MLDGKKILAIIPARGGSKRLPKKNILSLGGKPLIGWTIESAINSRYVDEIFVSTDDQAIADITRNFGVIVPELRPEVLSTDTASTQSVLFYTLETYGKDADIVVLLQPTSPFRNAQHIDQAIELLVRKSAFSVVSVTPCEHPPEWSGPIPTNGSMNNFIKNNNLIKRSQDYSTSYRLNGAMYIFDTKKLLDAGSILYREDSYAYEMSNETSVDIDNQLDFEWANFLCERKVVS